MSKVAVYLPRPKNAVSHRALECALCPSLAAVHNFDRKKRAPIPRRFTAAYVARPKRGKSCVSIARAVEKRTNSLGVESGAGLLPPADGALLDWGRDAPAGRGGRSAARRADWFVRRVGIGARDAAVSSLA